MPDYYFDEGGKTYRIRRWPSPAGGYAIELRVKDPRTGKWKRPKAKESMSHVMQRNDLRTRP